MNTMAKKPEKCPRYDATVIYPSQIDATIKTWKRAKRAMHLHPTEYFYYPLLGELCAFAEEGRRAREWSEPGKRLLNTDHHPMPHAEQIALEYELADEQAQKAGVPAVHTVVQEIKLGGSLFWWQVNPETLAPAKTPYQDTAKMSQKDRSSRVREARIMDPASIVAFRKIGGTRNTPMRIYACFPFVQPTDIEYAMTPGYVHALSDVEYINDPSGPQVEDYVYDTRLRSVSATAAEFSNLKDLIEQQRGMRLCIIRRMAKKWWDSAACK